MLRPAHAVIAITVALAWLAPAAWASREAPEPAPRLRSTLVARESAGAFVVIRLTGDLPRTRDGEVRATLRVSGRPAGRVRTLDRISFRHYCFRARLRRPWPAVGRRVGISLAAPNLPRPLRTTQVVAPAGPHDSIGARLGCRLPADGS